jgi:hypothetical protein
MDGLAHAWLWLALVGLGALHGVNPGMGWLFAAALGMQERRERAVWRALPPLALGHALSVGAIVGVALLFQRALPFEHLKWLVAGTLVGFGCWRLWRTRHPRYGGMRATGRELTVWSFLMASAHGAGLMVLPIVLSADLNAAGHAHHAGFAGDGSLLLTAGISGQLGGLIATGLHTIAYLATTGLVAAVVYRKVGVRFLRRGWLNIDTPWGIALVATGLLTLLL